MTSIRPYSSNDLDAVIAVFQGAVREVASRDYNAAQIDAWAQVDRGGWSLARASKPTWVAEIRSVVIGFSDLEPDGHLDMMFVHPGYQGIGVATALLETVQAAAVSLNRAKIFTEASITARPFFERRGFVVAGPQMVEKRGQTLRNFKMTKLLD
jgi:putative acetyltransferase